MLQSKMSVDEEEAVQKELDALIIERDQSKVPVRLLYLECAPPYLTRAERALENFIRHRLILWLTSPKFPTRNPCSFRRKKKNNPQIYQVRTCLKLSLFAWRLTSHSCSVLEKKQEERQLVAA